MMKRMLEKSMAATKRALAWRLEDMAPPAEKLLFTFKTKADLARWTPYSDKEHGGQSTASTTLEEQSTPGSFRFAALRGELSTEIPEGTTTILRRSGFAGLRTSDAKLRLDLEPFDTLAFRVRGDGRVYVSNLRTDNWVGGPAGTESNTWQAFLFAPPGEWSTVKIPLRRYLLTWKGKLVDDKSRMNPSGVVGMGLSLTARGGPEGAVEGDGPYKLDIEWIKGLRTHL
eukprot:jgi/Mesen1/1420/ME001303S00465